MRGVAGSETAHTGDGDLHPELDAVLLVPLQLDKVVEQPSVLTGDGLQVEVLPGEGEPDGVEGLETLKDRDPVAVHHGWDAPGEGEGADVAVGGEAVGGAGDVGGERGHGDGVEAVAHGTPHVSEPALCLVPGEKVQQELLSAAPVLVSAGVRQEVYQPVGHVGDTLLGDAHTQRSPAGGTDLGPDDADLADEVTVTTAEDRGLSDGLQGDVLYLALLAADQTGEDAGLY